MIRTNKKLWQFFAVLAAIIVFTGLLYLDSKVSRKNDVELLNLEAARIQKQFDDQIQAIIKPLPKLTRAIFPVTECSESAIKQLGQFAFSEPKLSTIAVGNHDHSAWCISPEFKGLLLPQKRQKKPTLIGPVQKSPSQETFFILQYPSEQGTIYHLFLLQSVIKDAIQTDNPIVKKVTIFNQLGAPLLSKTFQYHPDSENHVSIGSRLKSGIVPNIFFQVDGDEIYVLADNSKRLWSLRLLSLCVAGLLFIILLMQINRSFSMNKLLQRAIKDEEFYPIFQPVIDARTQKAAGAEILIRWQNRSGQEIAPNHFIEEAELTMNIVPMTKQLIEQSFQNLGGHLQTNRSFHLGINLCRAHFVDPDWLPTMQKLCQQYNILPSQLLLEVTERTMIDTTTQLDLAKRMQAMHDAGFTLAIDDFGTSHASISYLRHFPLDYLKIDMMYVQAIGTGAVTEALLPPIILIANQLNLKIIAEGVENDTQLSYLNEKSVDYFQGWYFAKAMTAEDLLIYLTM